MTMVQSRDTAETWRFVSRSQFPFWLLLSLESKLRSLSFPTNTPIWELLELSLSHQFETQKPLILDQNRRTLIFCRNEVEEVQSISADKLRRHRLAGMPQAITLCPQFMWGEWMRMRLKSRVLSPWERHMTRGCDTRALISYRPVCAVSPCQSL
jgi:hypothetical protein